MKSEPEQLNRNLSEQVLKGISASPGIAIGTCLVTGGTNERTLIQDVPVREILSSEITPEIQRFQNALEQTRQDIMSLRKMVKDSMEEKEASIFDAHLLIVDDKMLMNEVIKDIENKKLAAETVFAQTIQKYIAALSAVNDMYLKERATDVADVAGRVLANLSGKKRSALLDKLPGQRIIISRELAPSDTAQLDRENVQAFVTETGSKTSHSAILARSMKIPAVVGIPGILLKVQNGDMVIVDGFKGEVILSPSPETLDQYARQEASREQFYNELLTESSFRPETQDGYRVELAANLDDPSAFADVKTFGAGGIGLFRTEYLFMNATHIPTEEEQYKIYSDLAEKLGSEPLIIRTLDLGGDKVSELIHFDAEANPFLGLRSIRLCLAYPQLLIPQLRAILRAGLSGNVKMMFPMITCEDELDSLYKLLDDVKASLRNEKIKFCENMETGIMIETPAAALCAEHFAGKCSFFSIGTNDLVQYTMAVDRGNERVAPLYRPLHPAILRLLRNVVDAAAKAGIWVSVCGEMASEPRCIPLLIGLGVQELSMSPVALTLARRVVRSMKFVDAEQLAKDVMACATQEEVVAAAEDFLKKTAPNISDFQ